MSMVLLVLAVGCLVIAGMFFVAAESAIHEIEAIMFVVCSGVLLSGAAIVEAINTVPKRIRKIVEVEAEAKAE